MFNLFDQTKQKQSYDNFKLVLLPALAVGQVKDAGAVGGVGAGVVRVRSGRAGRAAHAAPHRQRRRRRPAVASLRTRRLRLRTPCLKEHAAYAISKYTTYLVITVLH